MNPRDLKSLNSTISEVAKPETQDKSRMIQEGFGNSLTARARQIAEESEKESAATEKAEGPKHDAEEMKKMMAKALKRAKKKARLVKEEEDIELAEVAAPGYEDWASNPKVKARFKERYGKRWKQVMYGHSWNMKEAADAEAELDLAEAYQAKRMRIIRKAIAKKDENGFAMKDGQGLKPEVDDFMKRSFKKKLARSQRIWDARSGTTGQKVSSVADLHTRAAKKHSAMKAKGLAESEQVDEEWGGGFQSFRDAHREVQAGLRREASAHRKMVVSDIKAVLSGKMTKNAFTRKHKIKFGEHTLAKRMAAKAKARRLAESEQLEEGYDAKRLRLFRKNKPLSPENVDFLKRSHKKRMAADDRRFSSMVASGKLNPKWVEGRKNFEYEAMRAKGLAESEQLDEAGYKRLMRLKKAAYKAGLASRNMNPKTPKQDIELNRLVNRHGKLGRAAAEREAQVAASFARRGGASPDAVRGGGSRIGPSGKYTQKAGKLANQRDKALAKFRSRARAMSGSVAAMKQAVPDMWKNKRAKQQAQAAFERKARSGDFGQDNQAALRARSNFQKRYGRLKGK